jgi:hypothetical protein
LQQFPRKNDRRHFNSTKKFDVTTGVAHQRDNFRGSFTRSMIVQQNVRLDPGAAALRECLREFGR